MPTSTNECSRHPGSPNALGARALMDQQDSTRLFTRSCAEFARFCFDLKEILIAGARRQVNEKITNRVTWSPAREAVLAPAKVPAKLNWKVERCAVEIDVGRYVATALRRARKVDQAEAGDYCAMRRFWAVRPCLRAHACPPTACCAGGRRRSATRCRRLLHSWLRPMSTLPVSTLRCARARDSPAVWASSTRTQCAREYGGSRMTLRLLIEECLSPEIVQLAMAAGHMESTCVRDRGRLGTKDWKLVVLAVEGDYTLVIDHRCILLCLLHLRKTHAVETPVSAQSSNSRLATLSAVLPIEQLQQRLVRMRTELAQAKALICALETNVSKFEAALAEAADEGPAHGHDRAQFSTSPTAAVPLASGGVAGAVARGEKLLQGWVQDGILIPSAALGSSWGITRQALDQAVERGELFSLKIAGRRYYLTELRDITREQTAQVCCALGKLSPSEKLMFWLHAHGGLQGSTPVVAIQAGQLARTVQLAQAWALEHTQPDTDSGNDART